jgi:flavin-dependent thymidylate synthase
MIKVVTEPKVYLVGACLVEVDSVANFLDDHGIQRAYDNDSNAGEDLAEVAGRLCYMSFKNPRPGGNKAYIKHLLEVGHGSVLEHAVYSLILAGVSRSFTHELVRHRHLSFSQLSQRYVDESDVAFVAPPALVDEVTSALDLMQRRAVVDRPRVTTRAEDAGLDWVLAAGHALKVYRDTVDYPAAARRHLPPAARPPARPPAPCCRTAPRRRFS